MSRVLFAICLNDLQQYIMAERSGGLPSSGREARGLGWEREDESLMLKMFMLMSLLCALNLQKDYSRQWMLYLIIAISGVCGLMLIKPK